VYRVILVYCEYDSDGLYVVYIDIKDEFKVEFKGEGEGFVSSAADKQKHKIPDAYPMEETYFLVY
jgi:hypothetical protein